MLKIVTCLNKQWRKALVRVEGGEGEEELEQW